MNFLSPECNNQILYANFYILSQSVNFVLQCKNLRSHFFFWHSCIHPCLFENAESILGRSGTLASWLDAGSGRRLKETQIHVREAAGRRAANKYVCTCSRRRRVSVFAQMCFLGGSIFLVFRRQKLIWSFCCTAAAAANAVVVKNGAPLACRSQRTKRNFYWFMELSSAARQRVGGWKWQVELPRAAHQSCIQTYFYRGLAEAGRQAGGRSTGSRSTTSACASTAPTDRRTRKLRRVRPPARSLASASSPPNWPTFPTRALELVFRSPLDRFVIITFSSNCK